MIIGNCPFERILGKFENTPLIRLSFVSICHCESRPLTLAMQTATIHPQHCGIRKRAPNEFWNFLTASPFAGGLQLDFFRARFRFLLVRWSVGNFQKTGQIGWKSHIFWQPWNFFTVNINLPFWRLTVKKTFFDGWRLNFRPFVDCTDG